MERYIKIVLIGFSIFPFIALFITIPFIIHNYHKYGSINRLRTIIIYSFVLYLLCAYFLVILPLPTISYVAGLTTPKVQLVLGSFITDIFTKSGLILTNLSTYLAFFKSSYFIQPIFNIVLTIPFGIYLHYYFKCSTLKTILYSFLLSLFFELTQLSGLYFIYPRSYRLFDVDDLLLNTLGGFIGYYIANWFIKVLPNRDKIDEESYKKSKVVSGLRRITAYNIDMFFIVVIFIFSMLFGLKDKCIYVIIVAIEVIYPLIFGSTFGERIVHIKAISTENKQYKLIIYFILKTILLFIMPIYCLIYARETVFLLIMLYFIYFIIILIRILSGHMLLFEKFLHINFANTLLK